MSEGRSRDSGLGTRDAGREAKALWLCCPHCKGTLSFESERCRCAGCGRVFPVLFGIPDLRVPVAAWIDFDEDRSFAAALAADPAARTFEGMVTRVWESRRSIPASVVRRRLQEIANMHRKSAADLSAQGWIGSGLDAGDAESRCLEIGCGTGGFVAAAASRFSLAAGIDVSMTWLLVTRRRLEEAGATASLACACAERLPVPDGHFDAVVAQDVLEHVGDRQAVLAEMDRVTRPGGAIFTTTPNRFSLSAEPHVGVWGVGFVPRRWMKGYVRWRRGMDYPHTYLLSLFGLRRMLSRLRRRGWSVRAPALDPGEVAAFTPVKQRFARFYNRALRIPWLRWALLPIVPFFQVVVRKNSGSR